MDILSPSASLTVPRMADPDNPDTGMPRSGIYEEDGQAFGNESLKMAVEASVTSGMTPLGVPRLVLLALRRTSQGEGCLQEGGCPGGGGAGRLGGDADVGCRYCPPMTIFLTYFLATPPPP